MPQEEEGLDSVTEVTQTSWLERIGQSFVGVIIGFVLIVASCVLIFVNEGHAVKVARSLSEGAGLVRTVPADKVDPANDGKLIHLIGMLSASGPVTDADFGMRSTGLRLVRRVEMYQWIEEEESDTKKNLGGSSTTTKTYKYRKDWTDRAVDSSKFKAQSGHGNPQMTWRNRSAVAPNPKLGAFAVPPELLGSFGTEQKMAISDAQAQAVQKRLNRPVQVADGVLYVAQDPSQPNVGDLRVTFSEVPLQTASIVAAQAGPGLAAYRARAGGTVELVAAGAVPAAEMFREAQDDNRTLTWIFRGVLTVAMFIGYCLITGPISTLADVIPLLGDVVRLGTGFIAFLGTVVMAPLLMAIAWFVYRPLVAVAILVVGAGLAYGVLHLSRMRKAAAVSKAA